jgi:nucleotide-binding universal stress UspA family protein
VILRESLPGDAICLGLTGRFRRAGAGSSTRSLVTRSRCPVLVVSGPLRPINRILTPYDGTVASTRALIFAKDLASRADWPLSVLAFPRGELTLEEALDWAQHLAVGAQVIAVDPKRESEAKAIERTVDADPFALLVMGAYADSWIKELFAGSVTGHVVTHLRAPILLVPGQAAAMDA